MTPTEIRQRFGWPDAEASDRATPAYLNVVDWGWYDRAILCGTQPTPEIVDLFGVPIGSQKGPEFTNMWMANCLPAPETHSISQIVALFGKDDADAQRFRERYVLELYIGQKIYERLPLLRFPLWGSLQEFIEIDGEIEVQYPGKRPEKKPAYTVKSVRFEEPWAYNFQVPQTIAALQYFSVKLVGRSFTPESPVDITVLLNGLTAFGVQ